LRYRLRFLLQEFDLPRGTTIIGRSLDCNLTIEDPLVSREHAQIIIDDDGARVEDLRSRNGVRVNGLLVRKPTHLRDGDRVRIGTQDLVFCRVDTNGKAHSRTTGVLRLCAKCRLPYAREVFSCPHCEATEQTDEGTLATDSEDYRVAWSVQLIVETLERALGLGRPGDAERVVTRATGKLDELLLSGEMLDADALRTAASKVASMTLATDDPRWLLWVIDLHRRTASVPSLDVVDKLAVAAARHSVVLGGPLGELLDSLDPLESSGALSEEEIEGLARLQRTRRLMEGDGQRGRVESRSEWPGVP
jgi:pSer/pThr/pTyr-binding forkhead associated (FHA) protein